MKTTIPTKSNPAFGIIAPTAYLSYCSSSRFHLVLAHLVDTDPVYRNKYKQLSDDGDFIIMDNGAFELGESYEPGRLVVLGRWCGADAIVLPDYPGQQSLKTVRAATDWGDTIKDAGFMTMFVPQSEVGDLTDWINAYTWANETPWIDIIGMSILGIPNALPHIPRSYARIVMTQLLKDRGFTFEKYHHYLGLNSPNELPALVNMKVVNSCDSSNPVWCGINGLRYNLNSDSYMPISKKYLREVDFNQHWIDKSHIHSIIKYNIDIIFEMLQTPMLHL